MKLAAIAALVCAPLLWAGDYPAGPGHWKYPGLWLKVSDEAAPAGGVVQIQITLTEPKPIIRTRMVVEFDETLVEEITAASVFSEGGEAMGTATRRGGHLIIEAASPTGELGNSEEYPVVTLTVRLRSGAAPGSSGAFRILPESTFLDANGADWVITENAPGSVTVAGSLSIAAVTPAAGMVAAGTPVRILGAGFVPWSKVEIYDAPAMTVTYVSASELTVRLAEDFQIDQKKVEVVNPDLTERAFFPAVRGIEATPSSHDLLSGTMPMFSHNTWRKAAMELPDPVDEQGRFAAIALQNPGTLPLVVRLYVDDSAVTVTLLASERLVRSLGELFPALAAAAGQSIRLEASAPVQALGLVVESVSGAVLPLPVSGE